MEYGPNPEEEYANREIIEVALNSLDDIEQKVLRLMFFKNATLQDVADLLGLKTKERVRQIKLKALKKLEDGHNFPPGVLELLKQLQNK